MKILYIASGIPLPGMLGGSTHTLEVARGLVARGHALHVVACSREGWGGLAAFARPASSLHDGFHLHHLDIPKSVSLLGAPAIMRLARATRPNIIMERYYNFAGGGVWVARRLGIPAILEVNALIVDPPRVFKRWLDDRLGGPMRRWAVTQCCWAARIVTPLHTTVPPDIPRAKIVELPWGANVERFAPAAGAQEPRSPGDQEILSYPVPLSPPLLVPLSPRLPVAPTVVFLGSFRAWHGVLDFVRAGALLLADGRDCRFLMIGDGPERATAERLAAPWAGRFHFTGAVAYDAVPRLLAEAFVGVAPFITAPHPALRAAGFFWSPLKVYEYMAAGLPVVTTDIHPLNQVIRDGREGVLFSEGDVAGLARAIRRVIDDPELARAMGRRARARVVEHYSWERHCAELERIAFELVRD